MPVQNMFQRHAALLASRRSLEAHGAAEANTFADNAAALEAQAANLANANAALDVSWTIFAACLVFMMHAGFALLESGYVRYKSFQAILFKGMFTITMAAVMWEVCGYGVAFGEDSNDAEEGGGFMGTDFRAPMNADLVDETGVSYSFFFFQWTFCATTATIISGAMAERVTLHGYAAIATYMTAFVYPCVVHWCWSGGLLSDNAYEVGFNDFAGSGVVHMCGGFAALTGVIVQGPRKGRFAKVQRCGTMLCTGFKPSSLEYKGQGEPLVGSPTYPLNIVFGTFLLWFGWFGFNAGSTVALSGGSSLTAARCCCTTLLSAAFGGMSAVTCGVVRMRLKGDERLFSVSGFANGILGGLVSITAGCANVDLDAASALGIIGGFCADMSAQALQYLCIDDVVGAFPVHGFCGIWGVIGNGIFDMDTGSWSGTADGPSCLSTNVTGVFVIAIWSTFSTLPLYMFLAATGNLRPSLQQEAAGLDSEFLNSNVDPEFYDGLSMLDKAEVPGSKANTSLMPCL